MVIIQLSFAQDNEVTHAGADTLFNNVTCKPFLAPFLPGGLHLEALQDRTSFFLTLWLPRSRATGGTELTLSNYAVVPAITVQSNQ